MFKIFATIIMLVDHIGLVFFPNIIEFRILGRLAMPIYAYFIALGFNYSNKKQHINKYIIRLFIIGVASQIPYFLVINKNALNICFLWIFSIVVLWVLKNDKFKKFYKIIFSICISFLIYFLKIEYGIYGLFFVLIFYFYQIKAKDDKKTILLFLLLHLIYYLFYPEKAIIQIFSLPSILLLIKFKKYDKLRLNKYIFYLFYPIHLVLILLVKILCF